MVRGRTRWGLKHMNWKFCFYRSLRKALEEPGVVVVLWGLSGEGHGAGKEWTRGVCPSREYAVNSMELPRCLCLWPLGEAALSNSTTVLFWFWHMRDACASMFLCVPSTCTSAHAEARGLPLSRAPPRFWDRVSHGTWSSLIQLGLLASGSQGSTCPLPSTGWRMAHRCAWRFRWALGIWPQALLSAQQVLSWLSHLPKPMQQFFKNQTRMGSKPSTVVLSGFINDVSGKKLSKYDSNDFFLFSFCGM